jgi:phosphocarrier protein HPr
MITKNTTIINEHGLHARPASDFVQAASKFKSKIMIARADDPENFENAKSIISVLLLGLCKGDDMILTAEGEDEQEAANYMVELINSSFGE